MAHVIIYGISNVGLRTAELLQESGVEVTLAAAEDSMHVRRAKDRGISTVVSHLRDYSLFEELGLRTAGALILPSDDEHFNLEAALHAIDINPDIKVVIRLFNLNLARKLQEQIKNITVLSVSQVSSPSFAVSALIERPLLSFKVDNAIMSFYDAGGERLAGKTVRGAEADNGFKIVSINDTPFPAGDTVISAADRLTLFSGLESARHVTGLEAGNAENAIASDETRKKRSPGAFIRTILHTDRILAGTISTLLFVVVFCVVYFHFSENLSFTSALYFVVTILTTVGFGDINLKDSADISKIIGMVLMLSGVSLFAVLFAIITDGLVRKRLDLFMGKRLIRRKGHVILCGLGDVGARVLEDLIGAGEDVIVIERNPENRFINFVRERDIPFIISDATMTETLMNASVCSAKSIICATDDDMRNLETGLNARTLNKDIRVVLRIFEKGLAEKIERFFGIHAALSSAGIAAPAFAAATQDTDILNAVHLSGRKFFLKQMRISSKNDLALLRSGGDALILMFRKSDGDMVFGADRIAAEKDCRVYYLTERL